MDECKRGSQEGGRVGGSFNALIYAGCMLGCGVREAGEDKLRSNPVDIQAPGIPRRLFPSSSEAMVWVARAQLRSQRGGQDGSGNRQSQVWLRGGNKNHEKQE